MNCCKFFKYVIGIAILGMPVKSFAQNSVGIGTESPNPRAVLELVSSGNNQGLLVPRLTTAQRTATTFVNNLTQTENGLLVYDTNLNTFFYWQNNAWQLVSGVTHSAGNNITISPTGVIAANFTETQNLNLANNILTITNNANATPIDLTPYVNVSQTAAQVPVTPNANLLANNVQLALEELQTEILTVNTGSMVKAIYDPTNINANAFDLTNHTGNLPNTRITGLGTASTLNVGTALGNVVQVGPNGLPSIGGSLLTGLSLSQFDGIGALATLDAVGTAQITNNTIINEDISPSALIAGTKVVPNFGPQNISTSGTITGDAFFGDGSGLTDVTVADGSVTGGTGLGAKIAANTITNANISTTAAIAGTKVSPNFGAQDISTTGKLITNGLQIVDNNPSSTNTAFSVETSTNQPNVFAISAITKGSGDVAGYFVVDNASSDFAAVYGETRGTGGKGVMGTVTTGTGYAGYFANYNSANSLPVVGISSTGTGPSLVTDGKVGIAVTDPDAALDIYDQDGWSALQLSTNDPTVGSGIVFKTDNNGVYGQIGVNGSGTSVVPNAMYFTQSGPHPIKFSTNSIDRLFIGSTGNIGIGTNSPGHKFEIFGAGNAFSHTDGNLVVESQIAGNDAWFGTASTDHNFHILAGGYDVAVFRGDNGDLGLGRLPSANRLEVEGDASKSVAGSWIANSDRRIKTDIQDIANSIELIKKLRPVKFKYTDSWMAKHPTIKNQYYYNFIAQEYQQVFPESVQQSGEYIDGDDESILQIDTYNAQIASIKALQELIEKVEKLERENTLLKSQYETLAANQIMIIQQLDQLASLKNMIEGLKLVTDQGRAIPPSAGQQK